MIEEDKATLGNLFHEKNPDWKRQDMSKPH